MKKFVLALICVMLLVSAAFGGPMMTFKKQKSIEDHKIDIMLSEVIGITHAILSVDPKLDYGSKLDVEIARATTITTASTLNIAVLVKYGRDSFTSCNAITYPTYTDGGSYGHLIRVDDELVKRLTHDELVAIVAHEMGHIHRGHCLSRLASFEELMNSSREGFLSAVKAGYKYGRNVRTYARDEFAADEYALEILERMGKNPALLSIALERISKNVPRWAIENDPTHPSVQSRIETIERWAKMH